MNKIIELLESIKARPLMYIGEYDFDRLNYLLFGIHLGYGMTNKIQNYSESRKKVLLMRGWNASSTLVHKDMEKKGLNKAEIAIEIIEVEIETWKILERELMNTSK